MLARWQFWVATVVALLVALVAGYSMLLFSQNRSMQAELARRGQFLQQTAQLEVVYREMIKGLADLSVRNQDKSLTDLLGSQGITVSANNQVGTAAPAPAAGKGAKP